MRVVLVERINRSGTDGEYLSGRKVLHLAFTADAIVRLKMMFVVKTLLGSRSNDRVAQRAAHRVRTHNQPAALPSGSADISFRATDIIQGSNNHCLISFASPGPEPRMFGEFLLDPGLAAVVQCIAEWRKTAT
jgi:hypothetical protein